MRTLQYHPDLKPNSSDLGIEVRSDAILAPEQLKPSLDALGVRNPDALAAALQSFPTAIASVAGLDPRQFEAAVKGALAKLRPFVNARLFELPDSSQRRGFGAMPPRWPRDSDA